jgi:NADPH:quinone reductase-like Zn-dependent oxidoreductase
MSGKMMKAVRVHQFGGPEQLQLEQIPCPEPMEGEVLVHVHAAGILPIEWKIRQGLFKFPITFPYIPGSAFSGVIEEVGAGVTKFQKGQRVFGRSTKGTYAEYTTAPFESLALIPQSISFEEAAAISGGATTAWQALVNEVVLKAGDRVLIHGAAGGVGLFATQFAKWKEAYVIVTAGPTNLDFVRSLGADEVIDYTSTPFEQNVQNVDLVFDTVGGQTLERSWAVVKQGGTLITIAGLPSPDKAEEHGIKAIKPTKLASSEDLEAIVHLMDIGQVKAFIQTTFTLQQIQQAHELSQTGHGRGRIILKIKH